jgi:hypothetical protein
LVMYLCLYSSVGKYFRCEFYTPNNWISNWFCLQ